MHMTLCQLNTKSIVQLEELGQKLGLDGTKHRRKEDLILAIFKAQQADRGNSIGSGVLDIRDDGFGFLRQPTANYYPSPEDIYVSPSQIRTFFLKNGDIIEGQIRPPKPGDKERYFGLIKITSINGYPPEQAGKFASFESLVPVFPTQKFNINLPDEPFLSFAFDKLLPIGKGHRGLITGPRRSGKTSLWLLIAEAIARNQPDAVLSAVMVDVKPEEVSMIQRRFAGEVFYAEIGETAERRTQIADLAVEKAKRQVEYGHHAVVFVDSITHLAKAHNETPSSGKVLAGGIDSNALLRTKRLFAQARNIDGGASLTILCTAMARSENRMDQVILEELLEHCSLEIYLNLRQNEPGGIPPIDFNRSVTGNIETLLTKEEQAAHFRLRKQILEAGAKNEERIVAYLKTQHQGESLNAPETLSEANVSADRRTPDGFSLAE